MPSNLAKSNNNGLAVPNEKLAFLRKNWAKVMEIREKRLAKSPDIKIKHHLNDQFKLLADILNKNIEPTMPNLTMYFYASGLKNQDSVKSRILMIISLIYSLESEIKNPIVEELKVPDLEKNSFSGIMESME